MVINTHSNTYQCYLHIRQDTLHDVMSKQSHKGRLKHTVLGRLKNRQSQQKYTTTKGSLILEDSKTNYKSNIKQRQKWQGNKQVKMNSLHKQ